MKIAFVVGQFPVLSQTFILDQVTGLIDMGHQVDIFSVERPRSLKEHPDVTKYRLSQHTKYIPNIPSNKNICRLKAATLLLTDIVLAPSKSIKMIKAILSNTAPFNYRSFFLASLLMRTEYDVIHAHFGPNGNLLIQAAALGIKVNFLTTFHGYDINMYPKTHGQNCYEQLFKNAKLFTANTQFTKTQMSKLSCDESKIEILPVGLKIENFNFHPRYLTAGEPINILTVGRIVEKKGYEYALRAFAKIASKYNIKYTIVGGGPLENELKELVSNLGIQKQVVFTGPLIKNEIIELYRKAHIFLLASVTASNGDMEGQGLVLQEAQATGLPVISTLHNGIPDGVRDGISGFLVPEKDIDAIADKIEYLIENHHRWPQIGQAGRKLVEKNYNIKILNQKLVEIYKKIIEL